MQVAEKRELAGALLRRICRSDGARDGLSPQAREPPAEWRAMHDIRRAVLFAPDRHAIAYDENHPDDRADGQTPLLLFEDDEPVGVVRLVARGDIGIVSTGRHRRRKTAARSRPCGWMRLWSPKPRARGIRLCASNAAADAVAFSEKTGWHRQSWNPASSPAWRATRADGKTDRRLIAIIVGLTEAFAAHHGRCQRELLLIVDRQERHGQTVRQRKPP